MANVEAGRSCATEHALGLVASVGLILCAGSGPIGWTIGGIGYGSALYSYMNCVMSNMKSEATTGSIVE